MSKLTTSLIDLRTQSDPGHNSRLAALRDRPKTPFPANYTKKGWMDIRTRPVKPWKRRYFVLANNCLLSAITPHAIKLERVITLQDIQITQQTRTAELSFEIVTRRKTYYLRVATPGECSEWIDYLNRAATLRIKDVYRFVDTLGVSESQNTKVVGARHRVTGNESAIKIIDKRQYDRHMLANEVQILKRLASPYIVELHDLFETRHFLYLVMELCKGGELFERIAELGGGHYTEQQSCSIIHQIAEGVKYMHSMGIVHRDLKPENILCVSRENFDRVKIADFGISKIVATPHSDSLSVRTMQTQCGTLSYTAPEILAGIPYNFTVDYWSIGVIMHILLVGYAPYEGDTDRELARNILRNDISLDPDDWAHVSETGRTLVLGLLEKDAKRRLGAKDVLRYSWIESNRNTREHRSFMRARRRFSATVERRRNFRKYSMGSYEKSSETMTRIYGSAAANNQMAPNSSNGSYFEGGGMGSGPTPYHHAPPRPQRQSYTFGEERTVAMKAGSPIYGDTNTYIGRGGPGLRGVRSRDSFQVQRISE